MKENDNINLLFIILILSCVIFICKVAQPEVVVQNTNEKTIINIKNKYKHRIEVYICAKNSSQEWSRRIAISSDTEITIYKNKTPSSIIINDPGPCIVPFNPRIGNIDSIAINVVDREYKKTIKKFLINK